MTFSLHPADTAFGIVLLFLAGIFIAGLGWHFFIFFLAALFGAAASILFKRVLWRECAIFCLAMLAGALYYHLYFHIGNAKMNLPLGTRSTLSAVITDEPQPTEKFLILTVAAEPPLAGTITVLVPPESNFTYGELLAIDGTINPPDTAGGNLFMFSPKSISVL